MKRALITAAILGTALTATAIYALDDTPSQPTVTTAAEHAAKPDSAGYPLNWCLVSGETLGEMGEEPVTYNYQGRELKFCCKNCIKKFEAEPTKYIAMLDSVIATIPAASAKTTVVKGATSSDTTKAKTSAKLAQLDWCIVSGEDLGGDMGEAVKYTAKGRTFDLCCNGCKKQIDKRTDYYIARLDSALAGQIKQPVEEKAAKGQTH